MKRRLCLHALATSAALLTAATSLAQTYPDKPVKLIVPYAPGGTTDLLARIVATRMGAHLKQSFIVENRPGAGGAVGSAHAAKQPADGYTLVMVVESSHAVNPNVYAKRSYDPVKDFEPIGNIADVPNVLVATPAFPANDLPGVIKELKARPGHYSFGSSGNGGLSHINGELFKFVTGTQMVHVPYKGLGPALTDLMSGQINLVFDNIPSSASFIQSGQLKPLAVAAKILAAFREPFTLGGQETRVSASIGVALSPAHGREIEELVRRSDEALYRAKAGGRDACRLYGEDAA